MKRILAIALTLVLVFSLCACGDKNGSSGGSGDNSEFVGEWFGVGGDLWGSPMTAEEAAAYTLSVDASGKAVLVSDGESMEVSYTIDGDKITLKVDSLDMEFSGALTDGAILFDDLLGLGIKVYFAQEGTPAADPSLYIPEADKAMVGEWASYKALDILEEDVTAAVPELSMIFYGDHTVDIYIGDVTAEGEGWTLYDGTGFLNDSELDLSWDVVGEEIEVYYYDGEESCYYSCTKA